jgi:DNA-binding response OmpR family regulator
MSHESILVVEDEKEIRELMALHLLRQGYKVKECASAGDAFRAMNDQSFNLIILDWMLPGASGIDFLDNLKKNTTASSSVLMVTARAEPEDIVTGLEKGADDYLTKPFDPAVLLARVRALLRRTEPANKSDPEIWSLDGLVLNQKTYEVTLRGEVIHLTPSEFKLLATMIQNQGRVLTRDHLIENIQGEGINVIGRTVDTHVFGLRKKLGNWSDRIETIRGVGYRVRMDF